MDRSLLEKLRRNQSLRTMSDGREGVAVTVQYVGDPPRATRGERRNWLQDLFAQLSDRLGSGLEITPDSLSLSGQTVEAVVPVAELDALSDRLSGEQFRLDVSQSRQVVDRP
jgi:hypothetical protein